MKHEEYAAKVRKLNPIDDDFMRKMAEDIGFCQEIIRTIMGNPDLLVTEVKPQDYIKNLQGRSVILDAHCVTSEGEHFNVEVQKSDDDNHQKRVRYNAACVTANITDPGCKFEKVPTLCVIYITEKDFLKKGKTTYHVDRIIRETGDRLDNGFAEIYVNAAVKDDSLTSELMTIFTENDAYNDEKFPATSQRKRYFKEDKKGASEMSGVLQELKREIMEEGRAQGRAEGRAQGRIEMMVQMYRDGKISLLDACTYLTFTEEEFLEQEKKYNKADL